MRQEDAACDVGSGVSGVEEAETGLCWAAWGGTVSPEAVGFDYRH